MGLPRRSHFSVSEVAMRWGATMTDMRCFLESGLLQAQVLLAEKLVQVYHCIETPDKQKALIEKEILKLEGYVVVHHVQVRKIFRLKSAPIDEFQAIKGPDHYRLLREKDITPVTVDDLWISAAECARFEREHQIAPLPDASSIANGAKTGIAATTPGRPSVMRRIEARFRERMMNGETLPTMAAEAKFLHAWAHNAMPDMQVPSAKTIQNQLAAAE